MKKNIILFFFLIYSNFIASQNNLFSLINEEEKVIFTSYIFKGTKIVNGQSVELPANGVLQFMIQHRFGPLNSGNYNLYGLDYAQVRFSFEYGYKDWLSLGLARSSVSKVIDGNLKVRYKRQQSGKNIFPLTIVSHSAVYFKQYTEIEINSTDFNLINQLIYANQILIARKINRNLSLQLTPTFLHFNAIENNVVNKENLNDNISIGIGGRQKITKRISINAETFIQLYNQRNNNIISIGFDIETGGHVFQLHLSNSPSMIEPIFVTNTTADFFRGDIYFGFNISRVFTINSKK